MRNITGDIAGGRYLGLMPNPTYGDGPVLNVICRRLPVDLNLSGKLDPQKSSLSPTIAGECGLGPLLKLEDFITEISIQITQY